MLITQWNDTRHALAEAFPSAAAPLAGCASLLRPGDSPVLPPACSPPRWTDVHGQMPRSLPVWAGGPGSQGLWKHRGVCACNSPLFLQTPPHPALNSHTAGTPRCFQAQISNEEFELPPRVNSGEYLLCTSDGPGVWKVLGIQGGNKQNRHSLCLHWACHLAGKHCSQERKSENPKLEG